MRHRIRTTLNRWMASRPAQEYWLHTNIVGSTVELQAAHLPSGHLFLSRADTFDKAAEELVRLLDNTVHTSRALSSMESSPPLIKVLWQASQVVGRALRVMRAKPP